MEDVVYLFVKFYKMFLQSQLAEIIDSQKSNFLTKKSGQERELLKDLKLYEKFALIITGIRRSGKSTLLLQLLKENAQSSLYLNFEDIRLSGFEIQDFQRLNDEINERKPEVLFFDEIQLVENWEMFVRQKVDEGSKIVITGSNATLLSRELGTKLTGRHLDYELFPFSFSEFVQFMNFEKNENATKEFMKKGGFPEFLNTNNGKLLNTLVEDILYKDIAIRYGFRDVNTLKRIAVYLISNIGKQFSANKLKDVFEIKSATTMLEIFSHLENTYLVQFLPKFSYSLKTQVRNPKKVYVVDLGLFTHASIVFTDELGRRLENMVYLHLRRKFPEVYYFNEKKECDFIAIKQGKPAEIVQVCYDLNQDNLQREIAGLLDALNYFDEEKGKIITFNQKDRFEKDGKIIEVLPFHEFAGIAFDCSKF